MVVSISASGCPSRVQAGNEGDNAPTLPYRRVASYRVPVQGPVEGLVYAGRNLVVSVGGYGMSALAVSDLTRGTWRVLRHLPDEQFGEGITVLGGLVWQATWREGRIWRYSAQSLELVDSLTIDREVWGLTTDGQHLIASNGSSYLIRIDPDGLVALDSIWVHTAKEAVEGLNELEFVGRHVVANVAHTTRLAVISLEDGQVEAWIDLERLIEELSGAGAAGEPNGIALDGQGTIFVTGKGGQTVVAVTVAGLM